MSITDVIGAIPYRMAMAGGWIDQPFVSRHDPRPPGSMTVVGLHPTFPVLQRSGMATGTRKVAMRIWKGRLPDRPKEELVRELYAEENKNQTDPSGSQDMIGLIYPGVSRLDYDFSHEGGVFPRHIERCTDRGVCEWIERVVNVISVAPRPEGYSPLGVRNLQPEWIRRLGQSGQTAYDAIVGRDVARLGTALNECMDCWKVLLPQSFEHPAIKLDLLGLLGWYRSRFAGAAYSGCGGGYLYVISDGPVPGAFKVNVRVE